MEKPTTKGTTPVEQAPQRELSLQNNFYNSIKNKHNIKTP